MVTHCGAPGLAQRRRPARVEVEEPVQVGQLEQGVDRRRCSAAADGAPALAGELDQRDQRAESRAVDLGGPGKIDQYVPLAAADQRAKLLAYRLRILLRERPTEGHQ